MEMEWTLVVAVVAFLFLFPLFLLLCAEYCEDYLAASPYNEDQQEDGGYLGMVNEGMNQAMVQALSDAFEEQRQDGEEELKNKVRRRRRKKKKKPKPSPKMSPRHRKFSGSSQRKDQ